MQIKVGEIILSKEEFLDQVKDILTEEQIQECLVAGKYRHFQNMKGEVKWCPKWEKIRQTSCCACGCGNCEDCGHRWSCRPVPNFDLQSYLVSSNKIKDVIHLYDARLESLKSIKDWSAINKDVVEAEIEILEWCKKELEQIA